MGAFFYGQFHEKESSVEGKWNQISSCLRSWGMPVDEMKQKYCSLPVFDREQVEHIRRLLSTFAELCAECSLFTATHDPRLLEIERYVDLHLNRTISLPELASLLHMNASYLSSYFQKNYQICLTDYIREKRIQKACHLLENTRLPIHTIAEMVGFNDQNYFTKVFQKQMKITSTNYRKSFILR